MRACLLPLLAVATLLGASACGERTEPLGELEQPYPITVRGAGDEPTTLEAKPERIVALEPGGAEMVIALGARDRLVGIPPGIAQGDKPRSAPREAVQVVSPNLSLKVDELVKLEPDLIVGSPSTDPLDLARAQRETGAAVYVQPSNSIEDILRATFELGFVLGEPVQARTVASRIRSEVAAVEERVDGTRRPTAFVDTGFFVTVPLASFLGDLLVRARGESVTGETPGAEPIPISRLRRLDPEVYLATSNSGVNLRTLRRDTRTAKLSAVERGRVVVLPSDLVQRAGPYAAQALERVARALHPDVFRQSR